MRALDAVGGAALSVVAVLVVAWALGVAISGARLPWVTEQVRDSEVLGQVDEVMPDRAVSALNSFNEVVGSSFFPRYLEPFAPERIVEVGPPPAGDRLATRRCAAAADSVVKIHGENSCGQRRRGHRLPLLTRPGDDQRPRRRRGRRRRAWSPTTARCDARSSTTTPTSTWRCSRVDGLGRAAPGLRPRRRRPRDPGAVLGYPQDGPYDVQGARIRAEQRLRSPDIYGEGTVVREVFSVRSHDPPRQLRRPDGVPGRRGARRGLRGVGDRPRRPATCSPPTRSPRRRPQGLTSADPVGSGRLRLTRRAPRSRRSAAVGAERVLGLLRLVDRPLGRPDGPDLRVADEARAARPAARRAGRRSRSTTPGRARSCG